LVFAIALNDSHNQPILLQKLMSIFQDEKLLLTIKESQSASSIFDIIKLKFKEENVS
jgi:mannitol/fructose-specific phosphotransferase system IIA component (Ntr-type)